MSANFKLENSNELNPQDKVKVTDLIFRMNKEKKVEY